MEDHQRRKDRNKRRVSFKTSLFNQKSDVKLRLQDVRRWDEDDDMSEMTTTVKVRFLRIYKSSSSLIIIIVSIFTFLGSPKFTSTRLTHSPW